MTEKKSKPSFVIYMAVGLLLALLIEFGAAKSGDSKIFANHGWFVFFLIWYGSLLAISYALFKARPLWQAILFWVFAGPIIEMLLFRGHMRPSDIFYFLIFVPPLWLVRKLQKTKS